MRSGESAAQEETAADPVLRSGVLRAARSDRREGDLPLLRFLLERENAVRTERYEERWPAAMPVASHGQDGDVPLLREATAGQITDSAGAVRWARAEEARRPENDLTWVDLAQRQDRVENARTALIRMLDDTGPDADRLRELSRALEHLGDHESSRARWAVARLPGPSVRQPKHGSPTSGG
ncbi:hypothetical protein M5362_02630 [Streptomyces sp. Je 1-79]|uniref:hypothetical protein n=1 Tax=Streptomyces sp. Je 1-79 TaxID=2943847 RepID=UPI0021A5CBD6|nr:hypothetical protein [Streptomyces sp. Je 1-79]MCT4352033.1 hypothetical protein [Streptomyces sp. Je 1-79]